MKKLSLGISTCPNDTFIFDAMVNGRFNTGGLQFECTLTDVEELNKKASEGIFDITKISYHAYAFVSKQYILLNSGSALGFNNGPLLVSRKDTSLDELKGKTIAIPGKYTTASLLLSVLYPQLDNKVEYLFSDIEDAVLDNKADAGLLIHENRFTYSDRGLVKLADLGEEWQSLTSMPIPLGGIAVHRRIADSIKSSVDHILHKSIDHAYKNPMDSIDFVRKYAAAMDPGVMKKHIDLYVNEYSRDLGNEGRKAVHTLYNMARRHDIIPPVHDEIFV